MGVQRMGLANAKKKLRRTLSARIAAVTAISSTNCNVPKGHIAVYVGDRGYMKRFVIPITYLNHPLFHDLLALAEQEFGYDHPMGGLTLPCSEDYFTCLISNLSC